MAKVVASTTIEVEINHSGSFKEGNEKTNRKKK